MNSKFWKYTTPIVFCLVFACSVKLNAQYYSGSNINFGKSRAQFYTDKFVWSYYRFNRFDTYFYTGGRNLAEYTARYAQVKLPEIEKFYDYAFDGRIQFVIYNRQSQYVQSNVGLNTEGSEQNGIGLVQVAGTKVFLYFDGNHANLEKQISEGISRVVFNQFMLGGSFKDRTRWLPVSNLPPWFSEGIISYAAKAWDYDIDNQLADVVNNPHFFKLNRLTPAQAKLAGHSIWNYIALTYGENIISRILYMTKMSRSANNGLLYMLGLNTQALVADWLNFLDKQYPIQDDTLRSVVKSTPILNPRSHKTYYNLEVSANGDKAAYVVNKYGRYKIYLFDNATGNKTLIYKGGEQTELPADNSYPLIAFHPISNSVTMLVEKKGELCLVDYDYSNQSTTRKPVYLFDKITGISYLPNGQDLLVSGVREGISDVFIYNLPSNTYKALTNDLPDDLTPLWFNNAVLFSSNRFNDSLKPKITKPSVNGNFDLFRIPLTGKPSLLQRVTNTSLANETQPLFYDSTHAVFLSDVSGIYNRYLVQFDSTIAFIDTTEHYRYTATTSPLTNYQKPVKEHNTGGSKTALINYKNQKPQLLVDETPIINTTNQTPLPTRYAKYGPDTTARKFNNPISIGKGDRVKVFEDDTSKANNINIFDYTFDSEERIKPSQMGDSTHKAGADSFRLPKQRIYLTSFYTEGLTSKIDRAFLNQGYQPFDPNNGYINPFPNALFKITLKDVMEDFRITGAFRLAANFVGNEYLLRFENLKHRMDRELILHRQGVQSGFDASTRTHIHQAIYGIRYPVVQTFWFKASATGRLDSKTFLSSIPENIPRKTGYAYWGAVNGEMVFDNIINDGVNIMYGTRAKAWVEFYNRFDQKKTNTTIVGIDARHYLKIHRTFIAAFRVSASTSFGPGKLMYYMGGVDGWMLPQFDQDANIDQSQRYLFQSLANGVRGFRQNVRNGNTFFMASAELRFPVIRYLFNYNVRSEVLNNLQLIAFADVGSAFVGLNPYSEINTYVTHTVQQGPLFVTVKRQREPIIAGLGWGVRTKLLGYFIRVDVAKGIEDGQLSKTRLYISFGTDF
jgi:hypothetical protein